MPYMRRKLEIGIRQWAEKSPSKPLLIGGARRVGKTVLSEHVGDSLFDGDYLKLDFQTDLQNTSSIFEWPTDDTDGIIRRISEFMGKPIRPKETLIILDEVQLCEKALNSLRFFSGSDWRIIATGSLLGVATKQRSLPFPSGVVQMKLHPLDFEEYLWALGDDHMAEDIREHAISGEEYVLHERALELLHRYYVIGGMPKVLETFLQTSSYKEVALEQGEIDQTYTADMTNPENGISGLSAKRIWESLPKQLLRSSTKKFKFSEVIRGGRRTRLLEPLEWLDAAGIVTINDLTCDDSAPLSPFNDEDGSYFKVYVSDTGLMFRKFGIAADVFLDENIRKELASDFKGALAENFVMQSLCANGIETYYWMPSDKVGNGEIDFIFQDEAARVVPVEVKSSRNVKAKTLNVFVRESRTKVAYRLSERNFGKQDIDDSDATLMSLPLYAAFCI